MYHILLTGVRRPYQNLTPVARTQRFSVCVTNSACVPERASPFVGRCVINLLRAKVDRNIACGPASRPTGYLFLPMWLTRFGFDKLAAGKWLCSAQRPRPPAPTHSFFQRSAKDSWFTRLSFFLSFSLHIIYIYTCSIFNFSLLFVYVIL